MPFAFLRSLFFLLLLCTTLSITTACGGDDTVSPNNSNAATKEDAGLDVDMTSSQTNATSSSSTSTNLEGRDMSPATSSDMGQPEDFGRVRRDMRIPGFDFGNTNTTPDMEEVDASAPDMFVPLSLSAITPSRGGLAGGDDFVLDGQGFSEDTKVFFGNQLVEVELVADKLLGETPAGLGAGAVTIKAFDEATGQDLLPDGFTYTVDLQITSITPNKALTTGGSSVEVKGVGFDQDTRISFGGAPALSHEVFSQDRLRAIIPAAATPGPVDVRLTNQDESSNLPDGLLYVAPIQLDNLLPRAGSLLGGESVEVQGAGFTQGMQVEFGGVRASSVTFISESNITLVTPPAPNSGLVSVRLVRPDGIALLTPDAFYYGDSTRPLVAAVTPSQGPLSGGTEAEIIGLNLGQSKVTFGKNEARILDQSPTSLKVEVPAGASLGDVDITALGVQEQATLPGGYTYLEDLRIDSASPAFGAVAGGYPVILTGEGFQGVTKVEFGGVIASNFTIDSDTQITATAPPHAAGTVTLRLERGPLEQDLVGGFTYEESLAVFGFKPVKGSIAGGTYVEIRGRGFTGQTEVFFDGIPAPEVALLDPQTLAVRTPEAAAPGTASVEVKQGQDPALTAPQTFLYFDPGSRFGGVAGGRIKGAVNVAVFSQGGAPIKNAFVMLSTRADTKYQGWTNAQGLITFSGPDVYGEQTVSAVAAAHSGTSLQRIDSENITIFLNRLRASIPDPGPMMTNNTNNGTNTTGTSNPGSNNTSSNNTSTMTTLTLTTMSMNTSSSTNGTGGNGTGGNGTSGTNNGTNNTVGGGTTSRPTMTTIPPPPPIATFTGQLTGLNKLAITNPDERLMAFIATTRRSTRSRNPDPGPNAVLFADGAYRITTRTGDFALLAVGGIMNTRTQVFRPIEMAVARYQFATGGMTYTQDLELNIPLDQKMTIKLRDLPAPGQEGPYINRARVWMDFGFEGISGVLPTIAGSSSQMEVKTLPTLSGQMQGVSLFVRAGAYSIRRGVPLTESYKRNVTTSKITLDLPLTSVIENVSPRDGFRPTNGLFTFDWETPSATPDLLYVRLQDSLGRAVWEIFLPGNATSFQFPQFPDFSDVRLPIRPTPYNGSAYDILLYGITQQGVGVRSFNYTNLDRENWDGYSLIYQLVVL